MAVSSKSSRAAERKKAAQRRQRRRTLLLVAAALVGLALVAWLVLASGSGEEAASGEGEVAERFADVHGIAVPPWDDTVYVATHKGLIRQDEDGSWRYVSEQRHDFMGFSSHPTSENVFYASGHPAPGSGKPNPLGLMISTDGGETWESRSLEGRADFHTMTVQPTNGEVIYAWNGVDEPGLYRSSDGGVEWDIVPASELEELDQLLSLAVNPDDADEVWAGTQVGLWRSRDAGRTWEAVSGAGPATSVTFDPSDASRVLAYGLAQGLVESEDGGQTWEPVGWSLDSNTAVAYLVVHPADGQHLFAATFELDILESRDGGKTWETLARAGVPQT